MYAVNETATGYDLAELLQGESGIFQAISPNGGKFKVVAREGHSIANLRPENENGQQPLWRVRKIGELRSEQQTT